jgi:hypothetical protein
MTNIFLYKREYGTTIIFNFDWSPYPIVRNTLTWGSTAKNMWSWYGMQLYSVYLYVLNQHLPMRGFKLLVWKLSLQNLVTSKAVVLAPGWTACARCTMQNTTWTGDRPDDLNAGASCFCRVLFSCSCVRGSGLWSSNASHPISNRAASINRHRLAAPAITCCSDLAFKQHMVMSFAFAAS